MFLINHTETINDRIIVVEVNGALNSESSPGFEEYIEQLIENDKQFIIIDAANLEFVSSAGIGAFIYSQKKLNAANGYLVICNLPEEISSLYSLLGFDKAFRIAGSKDEAMEIMDKQLELRVDDVVYHPGSFGREIDGDGIILKSSGDSENYDVSLDGDSGAVEFDSPIILECAECKSIIRIKKPGNYICPDCKTDFSIDDDQTIIF